MLIVAVSRCCFPFVRRTIQWSNAEHFSGAFPRRQPQELVDSLNKEVGNAGWGSARGFYLAALKEAFLATGLDCSGFINGGGMRLVHVRRDGDKIVPIAEEPEPTPDLTVHCQIRVVDSVDTRDIALRVS
jgi:hypothetical protein